MLYIKTYVSLVRPYGGGSLSCRRDAAEKRISASVADFSIDPRISAPIADFFVDCCVDRTFLRRSWISGMIADFCVNRGFRHRRFAASTMDCCVDRGFSRQSWISLSIVVLFIDRGFRH